MKNNGTPSRSVSGIRDWRRLLALLVCELTILQPGLAAAQMSQVPMFTVTSVPPNVMLMFDDSASMQLLSLKAPPYYASPTWTRGSGGHPLLKVNTSGYFGISGIRHYTGSALDDGHWNFILADVLTRSPAFNPLAYNPAIEYKPWNNNGMRMGQSAFGGAGLAAAGPLTSWDMRDLPPAMGGGTVRSRLAAPSSGVIPPGSTLKTWVGPPAGSVRYAGLPSSTPEPAGVDLFDHTIAWRDPACNTTTNYAWTCPSGTPLFAPTDTCAAGNLGGSSADGTCCTLYTSTPFADTRAAIRDIEYGAAPAPGLYPPGTPPAMTGPASEVCSSIVWRSDRVVSLGTNCVQPPPYVAPCGSGGELCTITPPQVCDMGVRNTWRCSYTENFMNSTPPVCTSTVARKCSSSTPCASYNPASALGPAEYTGGYWPPARYVVYDGPQPGTQAERNNLNNYRMVMVSRQFGWNTMSGSRDLIGTSLSDSVSKYFVVDGVTGLPGYRLDCAAPPAGTGLAGQDGTWCTFEQEAQNYANWYTFYRSRLFAAIGVMSDVLTGFTGPEQYMRLGFGRINYFKGALNPWNVNSVTDIPYPAALPNLDASANEGAVERGVRPFTVFDPPFSALPNADRQAAFNWLFSINGQGPTPNRETMHAVGQYFQRSDSKGPWGNSPGTGSEATTDHLWCRRNYTILATDGEWTKLDPVGPFVPQSLLERASDWTVDPIASGVTTSMSVDGGIINGTERLTNAPRTFQYLAASEPQVTGGAGGTQTGTLTDVLHYYWSHDLRLDLRNSLDPSVRNRAFWQHLSSYVVGYGVNASMDDPSAGTPLRTVFQNRNLIAWPTVGLEACRQLDDNAQDTALNPSRPSPCVHAVAPSGNRINDSLRAALASTGDFFSANSPLQLRNSLNAVFAAIVSENAAGTAPSFSSSEIGVGKLFIRSGFFTNTWEGYVRAYDSKGYVDFLNGLGPEPAALWTAGFPAPASRNVITSTAQSTSAAFKWCSLSAAQQAVIDPLAPVVACPAGSRPIVDYFRGDQSQERRNGGGFRDRRNTILGDIVNSSPLYSGPIDYANHLAPAASYSSSGTQGYATYPTYLADKKTSRWPTVMFGANDGMFHVLDARVGGGSDGAELLAYVPRAVYPALRTLSDPAYTHFYTVDGPIVEGDVWNGTTWKTIVVASTGAGPKGLFALDMTAPQSGLGTGNVLWDIVPADHPSAQVQQLLGHTLGMGIVGSVRHDVDGNTATTPNGRWAFITGNGYQSVNNTAALLVLDALDGSLIRAIDTGVGGPGGNGLGAVAPMFDGSRNIVGIYAGDRQGNLWKFDLSSHDPTNWKIANEFPAGTPKPLFAAGSGKAIVQEPRITQHSLGGVYVAFGTGKYFEVADPADTTEQGIYVIWDKNQLAPVTSGQVEKIRLEEYVSGGETYRRFKATDLASYDWNDRGFWVPLRNDAAALDGERIVAPMILDAGVLSVTSFSPESGTDQCVPGGVSYLYRIDLAGGFTRGSYGALGPTTIGRRFAPGTTGAMPPVFELGTAGPPIHSMNASDVNTMMSNPKYRGTGTPVAQDTANQCSNVGLRVDGTVASIQTNCVGLMPVRAWRPLR
ncbi:MAG: pilus assembly protein [Burkholderiaceae bacterium]